MMFDAGIPSDALVEESHRRQSTELKRLAGQRRTAAVNEWAGILPTWYS